MSDLNPNPKSNKYPEAEISGGAPDDLDQDLVEKVTKEHIHATCGWKDESGEFYLIVDDLKKVGSVIAHARDHSHEVNFDGVDTLVFSPRDTS